VKEKRSCGVEHHLGGGYEELMEQGEGFIGSILDEETLCE
jgi:hypothetical protein